MSIALKNVTLSFPHLFQTHAFGGVGDGKYETTALIRKGSPAEKALKAEYDKVVKEALAEHKLKKTDVTPFVRPAGSNFGIVQDGDDMDPDKYDPKIYGNCWVLKAKSKRRPQVFRADKTIITDADGDGDELIYGGVVGNLFVSLFAYNNVSKGIATSLDGFQRMAAGKRFGGGTPDLTNMLEEGEDTISIDSYDSDYD